MVLHGRTHTHTQHVGVHMHAPTEAVGKPHVCMHAHNRYIVPQATQAVEWAIASLNQPHDQHERDEMIKITAVAQGFFTFMPPLW